MKRSTIAAVSLMWLTLGAVHALSRYSDIVKYNLDVAFTLHEAGFFLLSYASWIVVTLILLRILSAPAFVLSLPRLATLFIAGIALWLPIYFAFDYGVATWVEGGGWQQWRDTLAKTSGSVVFFYAVVYALTFTLCVGLVLAARARKAHAANLLLERQSARTTLALAEQQVQLMQSQLSPHFLFNALGAISYLARNVERDAMVAAIAKLGALLRFTIENASRRTITIREELQFSQDYVGLQELRFGDRFACDFTCDESFNGAQCLPFSLQPILENVFQHVVEKTADATTARDRIAIHVSVAKRQDTVYMTVQNSLVAEHCDCKTPAGHGTGLDNLQTRLDHTYGESYTLQRVETSASFRVELTFPSHVQGNDV